MEEITDLDPSLDLFDRPSNTCGIKGVQWQDFTPVANITHHSPIEFRVTSSSQYLDLSRSLLYIKARILKDGAPVTDADDVTMANLFLHTMFKQVDVSLNHKLLYNSGTQYHYKSYLETVMNGDTEDPTLDSQMFYKDPAGKNQANSKVSGSFSILNRNKWTNDGQFVELQGVLRSEICQLKKLLPNNIIVGIKLYQNSPAVALLSPAPYAELFSIEIAQATFRACKVTLDPDVFAAHETIMREGRHIYLPIMKSEIQSHVVSQGSSNWCSNDLFQNRIPQSVIIGLIDSNAYHGDVKQSCFNFAGHGLQNITVFRDGQAYPRNSIICDYDKNNAMDAYNTFITNTKSKISYFDYLHGYSLYAYSMYDDLYAKECTATTAQGNLTVNISFKDAIKSNLNVIIYAKFPGSIEINHAREVTMM